MPQKEEYDVRNASFKHKDTTKTLTISFRDSNGSFCYPNQQHQFTAKVGNNSGYLSDYPVTVSGNRFLVSSSSLTDLPAGSYILEIWESYTDENGATQTSIYPSPDAQVPFSINANIMDKSGQFIKELGFDDLAKAAAKQAVKQLDVTISSITMAPADTLPSVSKTVSDTGQVSFALTLPKGDKGDTGPVGPQGLKGDKGDTGATGPVGLQGVKGDPGDRGPQGEQGVQGNPGKPFSIAKVFPSKDAMTGDGLSEGDFVMIASNVDDPDNATLFTWNGTSFKEIADLSGAQGIQGPQGSQGIQGVQGDTGDRGPQGIQGPKGDKGDKGNDAVINVISQADYDALTDKTGVYFIEE